MGERTEECRVWRGKYVGLVEFVEFVAVFCNSGLRGARAVDNAVDIVFEFYCWPRWSESGKERGGGGGVDSGLEFVVRFCDNDSLVAASTCNFKKPASLVVGLARCLDLCNT